MVLRLPTMGQRKGTGARDGTPVIGLSESATRGARPEGAEHRVGVFHRAAVTGRAYGQRNTDGGTGRIGGQVLVEVLAPRCIAEVEIKRAGVQSGRRRSRPADLHRTAGGGGRKHRRGGGDTAGEQRGGQRRRLQGRGENLGRIGRDQNVISQIARRTIVLVQLHGVDGGQRRDG